MLLCKLVLFPKIFLFSFSKDVVVNENALLKEQIEVLDKNEVCD